MFLFKATKQNFKRVKDNACALAGIIKNLFKKFAVTGYAATKKKQISVLQLQILYQALCVCIAFLFRLFVVVPQTPITVTEIPMMCNPLLMLFLHCLIVLMFSNAVQLLLQLRNDAVC